jgi:hypothetical protein
VARRGFGCGKTGQGAAGGCKTDRETMANRSAAQTRRGCRESLSLIRAMIYSLKRPVLTEAARSKPKQFKESNVIYATVEASAHRLFPNRSLDQVMAEWLLERAQKNLIKYQIAVRQFETKYPQGFDAMRDAVIHETATADEEQDYFNWELAVSGTSDMTDEVERLKSLTETA